MTKNDFPFDHDSGRDMNRHRSNAKAEAGLEHRKLREENERLREQNRELLQALQVASDFVRTDINHIETEEIINAALEKHKEIK